MLKFLAISSAELLSNEWDKLATSYFQQKKFLIHTEQYNPCAQHYYEAYLKGSLVAGACVYKLALDLFTFSNLRSTFRFTIIGIPASISDAGVIGDRVSKNELLRYILKEERGLILCLNIRNHDDIKPVVFMHTLPTIELNHSFESWNEYISALRASYRRRISRINAAFENIVVERSSCSKLNKEMYLLYEQIMNKTKTKLEVLTFDFFKNLPDEFELNTYTVHGKVIAWNICLSEPDRFVFFFGGLDYGSNMKYLAYFNSLTDIVRNGIDNGFKTIEFGQTAEIPKLKIGGHLVEKYMFLYHKNNFLRLALRLAKGLLEYKRKIGHYNVFNNQD